MRPEAPVFEITSIKKQYKIMQCCIFFHFSLKCLVYVVCCIQSAFIQSINQSIKTLFHHRVRFNKKCSPREPCFTTMITNKNSRITDYN